jgi:hypothetical protein
MENYITVLLEETIPEREDDEGRVCERWLIFRHTSGQTLRVMDRYGVCPEPQIGALYKVVLRCGVIDSTLAYSPGKPSQIGSDIWLGKIIDPDWPLETNLYERFDPGFERRRWTLVETSIGPLVLLWDTIDRVLGSIKPGGFLQWEPARLDLLAVVSEQRASQE